MVYSTECERESVFYTLSADNKVYTLDMKYNNELQTYQCGFKTRILCLD